MVRYEKPQRVIIIGDFLDLNSISDFRNFNSPSLGQEIQSGINAVQTLTKGWDKLAKHTTFHLIEGNHEERWTRYVNKHPEFVDHPSPLSIAFSHSSVKWGFTPFPHSVKLDGIEYTHGIFTAGKRSSKANTSVAKEAAGHIVYGHTHRLQINTHGVVGGTNTTRMACNVGSFGYPGAIDSYAVNSHGGWMWNVVRLWVPETKKDDPTEQYVPDPEVVQYWRLRSMYGKDS